jgi:hypothetical protein
MWTDVLACEVHVDWCVSMRTDVSACTVDWCVSWCVSVCVWTDVSVCACGLMCVCVRVDWCVSVCVWTDVCDVVELIEKYLPAPTICLQNIKREAKATDNGWWAHLGIKTSWPTGQNELARTDFYHPMWTTHTCPRIFEGYLKGSEMT